MAAEKLTTTTARSAVRRTTNPQDNRFIGRDPIAIPGGWFADTSRVVSRRQHTRPQDIRLTGERLRPSAAPEIALDLHDGHGSRIRVAELHNAPQAALNPRPGDNFRRRWV